MSKILLIDDEREFYPSLIENHDLTIFRNSSDAVTHLEDNPSKNWDEIWLDHDLGEEENGKVIDIRPVVELLEYRAFIGDPIAVETIYVHTQNMVAHQMMIKALSGKGYNVVSVKNINGILKMPIFIRRDN